MPLKNTANRVYVEAIDTINNCRKTGIAATISVTIATDGVQTTITAGNSSGISEIDSSGVYEIPLTASQMNGSTIAVIPSTTTSNVVMEKAILYTEGGTLDAAVSTRLATSDYTTPPTATDNADAVWTRATRTTTDDISGLATASAVAAIATSVGTIDTVVDGIAAEVGELPTAEAVAESVWTRSSRLITGGAPTASSIATSVWAAGSRTLTATPAYNGPAAADIANAVCSTDLTAVNAPAGSIKTLLLLQCNSVVDLTAGTLTVYNPDGTTHATYTAQTGSDGRILGFRLADDEE